MSPADGEFHVVTVPRAHATPSEFAGRPGSPAFGFLHHLGDPASVTTLCGTDFVVADIDPRETWRHRVTASREVTDEFTICRPCQTDIRAERVGIAPIAALERQAQRRVGIVHRLGNSPDVDLRAGLQGSLSELEREIEKQVKAARATDNGWFEIAVALRMDEESVRMRYDRET